MAFESGGYAEKLGNRYEWRWVAKQLLYLLNEKLQDVQWEPVGEDEFRVDLWVTYTDGQREAQQCKARNASSEFWTVADLKNRGILEAMETHLKGDKTNFFSLVSAIPATVIGDICESARQSTGDPKSFYNYQITSKGEPRKKMFGQFCGYLNLNVKNPIELAAAYDYLRRTHFLSWSDDRNSYEELLALAGFLVTGEPTTTLTLLMEYAQCNLRKKITANDLRSYLSERGYHARRLENDGRVGPAVETLQKQFNESIAPRLISGELIQREETATLIEALKENSVVVLHGAVGCGKSGILYELTNTLSQQGCAYIPVRLDRLIPANTTCQFGQGLGLPESPTICLKSLAGSAKSVLILDQLDALRWTATHSSKALDVCKSLIREVRSSGNGISVVLACRTFDLENDPEIKSWLKESADVKSPRIEVKPLSEETVQKVVESCEQDFSAMSSKQKQILQSPHHLGMWVEIVQSGGIGGFQSSVQLMQDFWESRYQVLKNAGITADEVDEVIDQLTDYMEREVQISAPRSLVMNRPAVVKALHSHGVLQTTGKRVIFCHQSYLDFRIASRIYKQVHQSDRSVCAWLGDKSKQSLFRREQLRQALFLLSEEFQTDFLTTVRELLGDHNIRFHLKHLALEIVAQIERPTADMHRYLWELFNDGDLKDHILEVVYLSHQQYIEWLSDEGFLTQLLASEDENKVDLACRLLRSITDKCPDLVAEHFEPFADCDRKWLERIFNCLCLDELNDSERMFSLRLRLARQGVSSDWMDWAKFVVKHPLRAFQLTEAIVSTWNIGDFQGGVLGSHPKSSDNLRPAQWNSKDHKALIRAVPEHSEHVWELFIPHINRLTQLIDDESNDTHLDAWQDNDLHVDDCHFSMARGIVELTTEAGITLAKRNGTSFVTHTQTIKDSRSPITKRILAEAYVALPADWADYSLKWLMSDATSLRLGSGQHEPEWMPAVRLIAAQSRHCSDDLFRGLEHWLTHFHDPQELSAAKRCVGGWKEGWFTDLWGRSQYFLLPALCAKRRQQQTTGLIGVLERKYADYEPWRFLRSGHSTVGFVGSNLPVAKIEHIRDKTWMKIIGNKKVPIEHGRWDQRPDSNRLAESSVRTYSRDLAGLAKRFPERFGILALRLPADTHLYYVEAILDGMDETHPKEIPDSEKTSWKPARVELIEAVLTRFNDKVDSALAKRFCWLIRHRAEESWSEVTLDRLIHYATSHTDPLRATSEENAGDGSTTIHSIENQSFNCVRGAAAYAIGTLLSNHPDLVESFVPCISQLVSDTHPAVRRAALEASLPVLNINRNQAIVWFCTACKGDIRLAASRAGRHYFNCGIESHIEQLAPIIQSMMFSKIDEVALEGAAEVTARWLFNGFFEDELENCRKGTIPQRKGVAHVVSRFLHEPEYSNRCENLVLTFCDDEDAAVRKETRSAFRNKQIFSIPNAQQVIESYIKSKAFAEAPSALIRSLEEFSDSLVPYSELILMMCERLTSSSPGESKDFGSRISAMAYQLPEILLRLYEQSQDEGDLRSLNRCLDAWDVLFEKRVGVTRNLTLAMEQ